MHTTTLPDNTTQLFDISMVQTQPYSTNAQPVHNVEMSRNPVPVTDLTGTDANFKLSCMHMWLDTIKATKLAFDPVSDCFGSVLGTICCVATEVVNAANDRNTPATRHDVVHANQIRRNEAAEANACYKLGFFAGDALVDIASSTVGFFIGAPRAAYLACTGDNDRTNTVLGYSRDDINEVQLFDSCGNCCC